MTRIGRISTPVLAAACLLAPALTGRPGLPPRSTPPRFSLEPAAEAGERLPRLYSLLASRGGDLLLERYYHGARPNRTANIKSASKSVVSALVGIALGRGLIPGPDTPISNYFPQLLRAEDPRKREIRVADLVSMRSGLESTSGGAYGTWVAQRSWVRYALEREMLAPPGEQMIYSTGNTHLLSAILTRATGKSTWELANEVLAKPLGTRFARWPRDPEGIYFGGNDMELTPRQMMAFGELYARGGRSGGRQVVPADWIEASLVPRGRSSRSGLSYGYGWWIRELGGVHAYFAWGYGGQFIFVVPQLELVVVTTSSPEPGADRRGHLEAVYQLVENLVIRPIAEATVLRVWLQSHA